MPGIGLPYVENDTPPNIYAGNTTWTRTTPSTFAMPDRVPGGGPGRGVAEAQTYAYSKVVNRFHGATPIKNVVPAGIWADPAKTVPTAGGVAIEAKATLPQARGRPY